MARQGVAAIVLALAAGWSWQAAAQTGPCGIGNARNTCITQASAGVSDAAEAGDRFGAAVAAGDFDGDGLLELAVGAPGENAGRGALWIFRRTGVGWKQLGGTILESSLAGQSAEDGNSFARALAAGDFDQDDFDDLAIGVPGKPFTLGGGSNCGADQICNDAGRVYVLWGGPAGLDLGTPSTFAPAQPLFGLGLSDDENFGLSLAAGRIFGSGGEEDLAIGMPGTKIGGVSGAGAVRILFGDATAPLVDGIDLRRSAPEAGERFGLKLEPGSISGSIYRIAVGSPFDDLSGIVTDFDGGSVVFDFFDTGLSGDSIDSDDFGENAKDDDRTGNGVAIADFDGDGISDLAVGAPLRDVGGIGVDDSGQVLVAFGGAQPIGQNETQVLAQEFWGGSSQDSDALGAALQSGDLDGDLKSELLVSAHREGSNDTGFVYIAWGSPTGLVADASRGKLFSQAFLGGTNGDDDLFSYVLLTANFDLATATGGKREIVLGVPDKDLGGATDAGIVYISRAFDRDWIFADGFEAGSTTNWSATTP